jgi:HK97 family phage major capsid protein
MKKLVFLIGLILVTFAAVSFDMSLLQVGIVVATAPVIIGGGSQSVIKGLTEEMGKAHRQIIELDELASKENRTLNKDEEDKRVKLIEAFDSAKSKRQSLIESEERSKLMKDIDLEIEEKRDNKSSRDQHKENYSKAFRNYIMNGLESLEPEERKILHTGFVDEKEVRDMSKGSNSAGGYTVPEGFESKIDVAMKYYGGVMQLGAIIETLTGKDIPWPTANDTSNIGELLGENAAIGDSVDSAFGEIILKAYKFSSKKILVSPEFLEDNEVNLEAMLAEMIGERIGRVIDYYGTIGSNNSQPQGFVTGATNSGISSVAAAAITFENLIDLQHSVDIAYRKQGKWAFNDNTLKALRKLKDGENRYIWQPALTAEAPATILGNPYVIATNMADIGASAKSVVFGDFSKMKIRLVAGYRLRRLVELNAATDQIGFIGFKRGDIKVIDAGMHPLKYMVHAAS